MGRPPKPELPFELKVLLKQIGINIRIIREERGISQAELARRSSISTTTMNEIETKRFRDIRLSTLTAISQALNVPVIEILKSTDVDLESKDQARLLKASEDLLKITKKLR